MLNRMFFAQNVSSRNIPVTFGVLYNWFAANSNIAPSGWHVATAEEWRSLGLAVGGVDYGEVIRYCTQFLKSLSGPGSWGPGQGGDGSSGMNIFPAGIRTNTGAYSARGSDANFWCNGDKSALLGEYKNIHNTNQTLYSDYLSYSKNYGFGIRMVKDDNLDTGNVVDIDGNIYPTVTIGGVVWTAQNLRVMKYNDGTPILEITDDTQWEDTINTNTGAFCLYDNA